ncbi:hypothetical protein J6590_003343 [Homalodisca vitripennis]|nr:hypothetical protein J6590_003343 [Homalodisca vitripennis]
MDFYLVLCVLYSLVFLLCAAILLSVYVVIHVLRFDAPILDRTQGKNHEARRDRGLEVDITGSVRRDASPAEITLLSGANSQCLAREPSSSSATWWLPLVTLALLTAAPWKVDNSDLHHTITRHRRLGDVSALCNSFFVQPLSFAPTATALAGLPHGGFTFAECEKPNDHLDAGTDDDGAPYKLDRISFSKRTFNVDFHKRTQNTITSGNDIIKECDRLSQV